MKTMLNTSVESLDSVAKPLKSKLVVNSVANGISKLIANPDKETAVLEKTLEASEILPSCSRQTENRQDVMRCWLEEVYSRLFFLAKHDSSASFTSFVESLQSQLQGEVSEKVIFDFLLALEDFFSSIPPLSVPSRFFIGTLLETYRLLLKTYRECSTNLVELVSGMEDRTNNIATDRLQLLKKETEVHLKGQEELNAKEDSLVQLAKLVNDLEKFRFERARNFAKEIKVNEEELESYEKELVAIKIGLPLSLDVEQQDVSIKILLRNVNYKLNNLQQIQGIIDEFESKIIIKQKEFEENRERLLLKLENFSPKAALMKQLESNKLLKSRGNNRNSWFSEREKIKGDLEKNQLYLEEITFFMKMAEELFSDESNNKISYFVGTLRDNLRLSMQKRTSEKEREKIIKQCEIHKKRLNIISVNLAEIESLRKIDEVKLGAEERFYEELVREKEQLNIEINSLEEQITQDNLHLDSIKSEHDVNRSDLISQLNKNNQELLFTLKQLLEKEIKNYKEEQKRLAEEEKKIEIFYKSNELTIKINDLKLKVNKIKQDKCVWNMLIDLDIKRYIEHLEELEKWLVEIQKKRNELQKILDELQKELHELQKKLDGKKGDEKKEDEKKIKSGLLKQLKYKAEFIRYTEEWEEGEQLAKDYRMKIKNIISKEMSDVHYKIQQNEKDIRFNLKDREIVELKIKRLEIEEQFFHVVKSTENKSIPNIEKDFFSRIFSVLSELKDEVDSAQWNTCGWGFFCKKVPDGIQRIRSFFNKIVNELALGDEGCLPYKEQNLFMLVRFSDIYHLIRQKNSSKKCLRSTAVKRFYQSKGQLLKSLYEELESKMDPDWFSVLLANSNLNGNQVFDFLNNDLFEERTSVSLRSS